MKTCRGCIYFGESGADERGQCYAKPPAVMLLPVPAEPAARLARPGPQAQGLTLQCVRPVVMADDAGCRWWVPPIVSDAEIDAITARAREIDAKTLADLGCAPGT